MKRRIEWVDIAKGITILLVVFGHGLQGIISSSHLTLFSKNSSLVLVDKIIYGFHMPLFFFLSALFTGFLYRRYQTVIIQKVKRLLVPYFVWSFITAFFMQIASKYTNAGLGIKDFILSPIIPFSEYWFLYVLFFIFMLYLLVKSIFSTKAKQIVLFIAIVLLIFKPIMPDIWIMSKISQNLIFFAIGSYFFDIFVSKTKINLQKAMITTFLFITVNVGYIWLLYYNNKLILTYYWYFTALIGITWITSLSMFISDHLLNKITVFLKYCGRNTMPIYVMHLIPLAGLRIFLLKIIGVRDLWMAVLAISVISLLTSLLANYIIKHIGLDKYLFGTF